MTDRELFHRIMNFEPSDRVPNYELGCWGQTYERWTNEGMPERELYYNWFEGEPYFRLARRGFAHINVAMLPGFEYEVIEETDRHITARHWNGVVTKALKVGTVRGTRWSMDQYISFPVTDRQSFADLKRRYDPSTPTRYNLWWDEWARMWKTRDYPLCLLGNGAYGLYSQLRSWVGTEDLSYLFYDDPAFVEEMLEFHVEFLLATIDRALKEVEFDYFNFFEDFAGKGGPLVSPQLFRKFLLPGYQRIIDRMKHHGIKHFWLDSDGDTETIMPLLIEAGITCHWPLEQASGMDPVRLRNKFGKDLVFAGGIDKLELSKDKQSIDRELHAKIPPMLETGGFIPHLDHTFSPEISYENFLYYLELKEKLIGGAT